jgi:hypothetical protein
MCACACSRMRKRYEQNVYTKLHVRRLCFVNFICFCLPLSDTRHRPLHALPSLLHYGWVLYFRADQYSIPSKLVVCAWRGGCMYATDISNLASNCTSLNSNFKLSNYRMTQATTNYRGLFKKMSS